MAYFSYTFSISFFVATLATVIASKFEVSQSYKDCEKKWWDGSDIGKIVKQCLHLPATAESCLLYGITTSDMTGDDLLLLGLNCIPDVKDKDCITKIYSVHQKEQAFYAERNNISRNFTDTQRKTILNTQVSFYAELYSAAKTPEQLSKEFTIPEEYFDVIFNFTQSTKNDKPMLERCKAIENARKDPKAEAAQEKVLFLTLVYDKRSPGNVSSKLNILKIWSIPLSVVVAFMLWGST